ncbi:MAG: TadE/TadG family type IV pilus assembly protein [Sphingomicrobium sp.]
MTAVSKLIARLGRDRRGAAVIELAIVAPIFATMLIGMVDIGRGYSMKLQLEQAAQRAIEKVMNGQADKSTAAALKTEAATIAVVPETQVTVDFWLECNSSRQASYDTTCATGQITRRYLTVQISKAFAPMFSAKFMGSNADGTFTVVGKTGVRTQ